MSRRVWLLLFGVAMSSCLSLEDSAPKGDAGGEDVGMVGDAGWIVGALDGGSGDAATSECEACLQESCGAEWAACTASKECAQILACVSPCGGPCVGDCMDAHPDGEASFAALGACVTKHCGAACN